MVCEFAYWKMAESGTHQTLSEEYLEDHPCLPEDTSPRKSYQTPQICNFHCKNRSWFVLLLIGSQRTLIMPWLAADRQVARRAGRRGWCRHSAATAVQCPAAVAAVAANRSNHNSAGWPRTAAVGDQRAGSMGPQGRSRAVGIRAGQAEEDRAEEPSSRCQCRGADRVYGGDGQRNTCERWVSSHPGAGTRRILT
jgi:hypothetical protein